VVSTVITERQVVDALEPVNDAHVPTSLRSMGMLSGVTVSDGGQVTVELCLPCMACPAVSLLHERVRETLEGRDDVAGVNVVTAWHRQWNQESVDDHARSLMRSHGIQL
jgi:ATP-binding protein involved in chromosome partitioning